MHAQGATRSQRTGLIGLGNIGADVARHLRASGYEVAVFDVRPDAMQSLVDLGAWPASGPADVARRSDIVFTSLPGPAQLREVVTGPDGVIDGVAAGSVLVDLSTGTPMLARELEAALAVKDVAIADAPVSRGGTSRMSVTMVGAPQAVYERIAPVLRAFSETTIRAGDVGAGSVCKLVHNMVGQGILQALAEGFALGAGAGVGIGPLWRVLCEGSVGKMTVLHALLPRTVFCGDYRSAGFTLDLARKDLTLATELAETLGVATRVADVAQDQADRAVAEGWGPLDVSVLFRLHEEAAGVNFAVLSAGEAP